MNFSFLVQSIQQTHTALQEQAVKAINRSLTLRNWLIGFYIVEFEQKGEDRAVYGERLLKELAKSLGIRGLSETALRLNRLFYHSYPQIHQTVSDELNRAKENAHAVGNQSRIGQTLSAELRALKNQPVIRETLSFELNNSSPAIGQALSDQLQVPPETIINRLSFSHITELLSITAPKELLRTRKD